MHVFRMICLGLMAVAATGACATPESVRADIREAILLEGHACAKVVEAEDQATADYLATCSDGSRYRLHVTPGGRLVVSDPDRPDTTEPRPAASHPEAVKRMLAAVIHLSDAACGVVVSVVTLSPREHIATCVNAKKYRVSTAPNGGVNVDEK